MYRSFLLIITLFYSGLNLAASLYQVDLIIFAHQNNSANENIIDNLPLLPINNKAIPLSSGPSRSYSLLPVSQSDLKDEYYLLNRKSAYKILGHYSWRQPGTSQSDVALPKISHNGWEMQGTLRVRQSNYYLFDAHLQCSPPNNPEGSFTVSQKQRLKGSTVYYLDHPQIGMVVKVHKIA